MASLPKPVWFVRQLVVYADEEKEVDVDVSYGFAYIEINDDASGARLSRHVFIFKEPLDPNDDPKFWNRLPSVIDYLLSSFVLELGDDETQPKDDIYFFMVSQSPTQYLSVTDVRWSEIQAREHIDIESDTPGVYVDQVISRPVTWERVKELKVANLLGLSKADGLP